MKKTSFLLIAFFVGATYASAQTPSTANPVQASPLAQTVSATSVATSSTTTQNFVTKDTVKIMPGLSLTLSAKIPENVRDNATGQVATLDDGLFNLVYAGFEEFVFKVFGW